MGTVMSAADAAWLHMDQPHNLMVVNAVLMFDGDVERARVERVLRERLVDRFPRFRQRVVTPRLRLGLPHWEDVADFDVADHLVEVTLPAPGDDAALQDYVSAQMSVPLDRSRPLWQNHLIHGYRGGAALLSRMHHCIADGIALSRVFLSLTDQVTDHDVVADPVGDRHGPLELAGALTHQTVDLLAHPGRLVDLAAHTPDTAAVLAKELLSPPDAPCAFRGRNGVAKRAVWSAPVPLADVKRAARAAGATVNDVLLGAMAGALRAYLLDRGDEAHDLRVMVPFNLRPLDQPLPRDLGNRFGLVFLSLPVAEADPERRVHEVHRRMDAIKASPEGPVSYGVLNGVGLTAPQLQRLLVDFFAAKATAVMTNVPGPAQPVSLDGVPVRRVIGWVPRSGDIGLGISIFSYCGEVTVGFSVDAGLIPDPERLIGAFEHELDLLRPVAGRST